MKCAEVTNDLLLDFADWRLSPQERETISHHLGECRACRVRNDEMEWMKEGMRQTAEAPPPAFLAQLDPAFIVEEKKANSPDESAAPGKAASPSRAARPAAPTATFQQWLFAALGTAAIVALCIAVYFLLPPPGGMAPAPEAVSKVPPKTEQPPPEPEAPKAPTPAPPEPKPKPEPPPEPVIARAPVKPGPVPTPVPVRAVRSPIRNTLPARPAPPPPPEPEPPEILAGDLNVDGVVDIADARRLQWSLITGEAMPEHADMNGDGVVDVADVRYLTRAEVVRK